jgi:hypothetical protein
MLEASAVAQKLRLAQATAQENADRKLILRELLEQEISNARLSADERNKFLDSLKKFFPIWGEIILNDPKSLNRIDPADFKTMAIKIGENYSRLSESEKRDIRTALGPLAAEPVATTGGMLFSYLRPMGPARVTPAMEVERAAQLCDILVEPLISIDDYVAVGFKELRREGESSGQIRSLAQKFIFGPEGDAARPGREQIKAYIQEKLFGRIAKLLGALRRFSLRYATTRSPGDIETNVPTVWGGKNYRGFWEKYITLCEGSGRDDLAKTIDIIIRDMLIR